MEQSAIHQDLTSIKNEVVETNPLDAFIFETAIENVGLEISLFSPVNGDFTPKITFRALDMESDTYIDDMGEFSKNLDDSFTHNFCRGELTDGFERFFMLIAETPAICNNLHPIFLDTLENIACTTELFDNKEFREFIYGVSIMAKSFNPLPTIH